MAQCRPLTHADYLGIVSASCDCSGSSHRKS